MQFILTSLDWTSSVPLSMYKMSMQPRSTLLILKSFCTSVMAMANKTGDSADPCPTPISVPIRLDWNWFYRYDMDRPTRYDPKKVATLWWKPCFLRTTSRYWWSIKGKN